MLAVCVGAAGGWGCTALQAQLLRGSGIVQGEVRLTGGPGSRGALGPAVVYLEPGSGHRAPSDGTGITLSDRNAEAQRQDLAVIARGRPLRFASERGLDHRLFALRGRQRLDVAVPAGRSSEPVPMDAPGWLRFYCTLHPDESWDVFVAPSPWLARVAADGTYEILDVPPGHYRLSIWTPRVEGPVRSIRVRGGDRATETIWLDPARLAR